MMNEFIFLPGDYMPPGFADSPWGMVQYFFTLFAMSFMSLASLAMVIGWAIETRLHRRFRDGSWVHVRQAMVKGEYNAAEVARIILVMLYLMVIIGVTPDVILMMSWNEVSAETYLVIVRVDTFCDGLSAIPFLVGITVHIWSKPSLEHLLGIGRGDNGTTIRTIRFSKAAVLWTAKLAGLLLLVTATVTLSKVAGVR